MSIFFDDGVITNSTTQTIILMEVTASLNVSSTTASQPISVSGHINLSNGTNVSSTRYFVFLNDSKLNDTGNFTDTSDTDFSAGTLLNVSAYGSGADANLTLNRNESSSYPNATGNFTSKSFDAGGIVNWTYISWAQEVPYQIETGRASLDGNNAAKESGYINTSRLVLLIHFNNKTIQNNFFF